MTPVLVAACAALGLAAGTVVTVLTRSVAEDDPLFGQLRRRVAAGGVASLVSLASPLTMAATGTLFAVMAAHFGTDAALPAFLVLAAGLVALAIIDLRLLLLPNHVLYPTLVAVASLLAVAAAVDGRWADARSAAVGGVAGFAVMLVIHIINPAGLGFGDVRLSGLLGAALGWLSLGRVVLGLFLGFLAAALAGLGLMALGRKQGKDSLPFGPFLIVGALVAIVAGKELLDWYAV